MAEEDVTIEKEIKGVLPGKVERDKVGNKVSVVGHGSPRRGRHAVQHLVAQVVDVHDLRMGGRSRGRAWRRALDVHVGGHLLHLGDGCTGAAATTTTTTTTTTTITTTITTSATNTKAHVEESFVEESAEIFGANGVVVGARGVASNHDRRAFAEELQEAEAVGPVFGAHDAEQVMAQFQEIGEIVRGAFGGHAATIIETFVKVAHSGVGHAIIAGLDSGALIPLFLFCENHN